MSGPLDHKARIVAELQNRLGEATTDDDQDFLAAQLSEAGNDLEGACLIALRNARETEALVEALKSIEADNRARRQRLERRAETIRANVAWALQEAGLPKITAPDLTVSWRMGKPPLIIDREPNAGDVEQGIATAKTTYAWDKEAVLKWMETVPFSVARLGNAPTILTVRGK